MHSEKKDRHMFGFDGFGQDQKLYKAVYESNEWVEYYRPKVSEMINLNSIIVHNLSATEMSFK